MVTAGRRIIEKTEPDRRVKWVHALAVVSVLASAACTGSPATLAQPPDFEVKTPGGIASVSVRASIPGMTDSEFGDLVRSGMARAAPGSLLPGPAKPPFPECRIVWHVNPGLGHGASTLTANVFDRSVPVAYEQEVVTNSASNATIAYAIESVASRIMDANALSEGCHPRNG